MLPSADFDLFDLRVIVQGPSDGRPLLCSSRPGDFFELKGEILSLPPNQGFSIYSIAALLPLLPAKQRATSSADWMSREGNEVLRSASLHRANGRTDIVACPDPMCGSTMLIRRTARSTWRQLDDGSVVVVSREELLEANAVLAAPVP